MEATIYRPPVVEEEMGAERERRQVYGHGLIIIQPQSGNVLSIEELVTKPLSGRIRGERSIPFETAKLVEGAREPVDATVLGGLAEVFNDRDANGKPMKLHERLFHVAGNSYHEGIRTKIGGNDIHCGYTIMFYEGPDFNAEPYNALEVRDPQWVTPESLLAPGSRFLARLVMHDAIAGGVYQKNIADYRDRPESRLPMFDREFSLAAIYRERERYPDSN